MTILGTVSTTDVPTGRWVGGPWLGSTGVLYAVNTLNLMKSTDGGVTWTVHAQYTAQIYTGGTYRSVWGQQISDVLHLVVSQGPNNNKLEYQEWDLVTGNSITIHPVGWPFSWEPITTASGVSMAIRSTGEVVLIAPGSTYKVMGTDYQPLVMLRRNPSDGVWGDPVAVAGGSDQANYVGPVAVLGASNRVHFFYRNSSVSGPLFSKTLSAANVLSGAIGGSASASNDFEAGRGVLFGTDIRVPQKSQVIGYSSADSPSVMTEIAVTEATPKNINNAPVTAMCADAAAMHFVYSRAVDGNLLRDVNDGSGWGTDQEVTTGLINNVSANIYVKSNGDKVIGYLADDGGTLKYGEVLLSGEPPAVGEEIGWGAVLI